MTRSGNGTLVHPITSAIYLLAIVVERTPDQLKRIQRFALPITA
jgi:hypothetical protein